MSLPETREQPDSRERAGFGAVLMVLAGLALLVAAGYVAAYLAAGEKVPRGTTVAGVDVGGRTTAQAIATLRDELADTAERPVEITVGDDVRRVPPARLGLGVDYAASIGDAGGGRSWRPQRLWDYFTGGSDRDAVVIVDEATMTRRLQALGRSVSVAPQDGAVSFADARVTTTAPVTGTEVDVDQAAEQLRAAYVAGSADDSAATTLTLPLRDVAPAIDQADVEAAVTGFANPALSAPVTLTFGTVSVRLQPRDYAAALSMTAQDGTLTPQLDTAVLEQLVGAATAGSGGPVDATWRIDGTRARLVKAEPGVTYDPATIASSFLGVLAQPDGQRHLDVPATVAEPALTTEAARALKVKRQVSTFTTQFPYAEYRNTNIGRAAQLIDGTLLQPGETFSLNDTTGERTRENGFTEGFVISDGVFKEELGGGVSQVATTTFNAMFFAGLEDVEHKPHSFYISRYPVGREATVAFGAIDLRFRNDTPYGVLIKASISPSTPSSAGSVTVSMYSTKVWDITTATGPRTNPTQPDTRRIDTDDCVPNTGYGGFDIAVRRFFRQPGQAALDHEETFRTTYTPSDTVVCTAAQP